jgi:hypothetical protein
MSNKHDMSSIFVVVAFLFPLSYRHIARITPVGTEGTGKLGAIMITPYISFLCPVNCARRSLQLAKGEKSPSS